MSAPGNKPTPKHVPTSDELRDAIRKIEAGGVDTARMLKEARGLHDAGDTRAGAIHALYVVIRMLSDSGPQFHHGSVLVLEMLRDALEALNRGKVAPMLERKSDGRPPDINEVNTCKLITVLMSEAAISQNMVETYQEAYEMVSSRSTRGGFNISPGTISTWKHKFSNNEILLSGADPEKNVHLLALAQLYREHLEADFRLKSFADLEKWLRSLVSERLRPSSASPD